jgi:hypothetical protein
MHVPNDYAGRRISWARGTRRQLLSDERQILNVNHTIVIRIGSRIKARIAPALAKRSPDDG